MNRSIIIILFLISSVFTSCRNDKVIVEDVSLEKVEEDPGPSDPDDTLSKKEQILILNYNAIACACAQWSESRFNNNAGDREKLFLERSNNDLIKWK